MRLETRPVVGLDFGTTTTMVALADGLLPIGESMPSMPSLVGYGHDGTVVVGEDATQLDSSCVVPSVKRSITDRRDYVRVDLPAGIRDVRADDLIVRVLTEAARRAATRGAPMTGDVACRLGCPAMWDGRQRRRLLAAARAAGLSVELDGLVDEPVAAGIAWLSGRSTAPTTPMRALVFDMGGGTLDIALLEVRGISHQAVSVLAAVGTAEAGDALDEAIAADLDYLLAKAGVDVDALPRPDLACELLLRAARQIKERLSTEDEEPVVLDANVFGRHEVWYRRDQLNEIFEPQLDRAEHYVAAALRIARMAEDDHGSAFEIARLPIETLAAGINVVVLSGGMSRVPYVRQRLRELFPDAVVEVAADSPEDAVAHGLANASRYGRINMYRPAFDVMVEWDRGREFRTVYDAFTPLVEPWQIAHGGNDLRYVRNGRDLRLPRLARGRLRVVSHSGERVHATLGEVNLDGFPVALGEQTFEFSIYPNGRIRLVDASGRYRRPDRGLASRYSRSRPPESPMMSQPDCPRSSAPAARATTGGSGSTGSSAPPAPRAGRGREGTRTPAEPPRPGKTNSPRTGSGTASSAACTPGNCRNADQASTSVNSTSRTRPHSVACQDQSSAPWVTAASKSARPCASRHRSAVKEPLRTSMDHHWPGPGPGGLSVGFADMAPVRYVGAIRDVHHGRGSAKE